MEKKYFLRKKKVKVHEKLQEKLFFCDGLSDASSNTTNDVCSEHSGATCDSIHQPSPKNDYKSDIQVVIQELSPRGPKNLSTGLTDHAWNETIHSDLYLLLQNDPKTSEIEIVVERWWSPSTACLTEICVTLVNLLLEASGYPKEAINPKTVTFENYMDTLEDYLQHYDQGSSMIRQGKLGKIGPQGKFSGSQPIFTLFHTLCRTCPKKFLLHGFGRELFSWLVPLTKLYIRPVRQLSTVCLLHFNEELLHRWITFHQEFEVFQKHNSLPLSVPEYVEDYLSSNVALVPIEQHSTTNQSDFEKAQQLVNFLYEALINERWKDCCAIIRNATFTFLFRYSKMVPDIFLSTMTRISLIGYALSDREDSIRVMAAEYLADYVTHANSDGHLWKHGFFKTYRERLLDLPYDKNYSVCSAGLVVLTCLANKSFLEDKDVEKVVHALWSLPSLLVMESQTFPISLRRSILSLYDRFAQFINDCILSISVLDDSSIDETMEELHDLQTNLKETARHVLVLRCLLEFFVEFVDDYAVCVDVLVTTFWNKTKSVHRVDILLDFFHSTDQNQCLAKLPPLSTNYRLPLCLLLLSITRHLELAAQLAKTPRKLAFQTDSRRTISEHSELVTATHTLLGEIIPLLKTTKKDALQAKCLLVVLYEAALRVEGSFFQDQYLKSHEYLMNTFITTNDANAPFHLQAALLYCLEQHVFQDEASHYHTVIMGHLLNQLQTATAVIPSGEDQAKVESSILCVLLKLLGVSYAAHDNPYEHHFEIFDHLKSIVNASLHFCDQVAPFLNVLLCLQCLIVAYVHLWGDVDATINFLKTPTGTDDSVALTPLAIMSCKRRKTQWPLTTPEKAMILFQKKLTCIESLQEFIRSTFSQWIGESLQPRFQLFVSYVYTMALLDLTQFCFGTPGRNTNASLEYNDMKRQLEAIMTKLRMTDQESDFFSSFWTETLNHLQKSLDQNLFNFFKITRSVAPNFVQLYSIMSHSTLVMIRQQELLPFHCQLLLQHTMTGQENEDAALKFNDPLYTVTLYWMACTFLQRLSISPHLPFWLSSALGSVLFQLFFYNNAVLHFSLECFISNIIKSGTITYSNDTLHQGQSLLFYWISRSVLSLLTSHEKSARLKAILFNIAKFLPLQYFIENMDSFFQCIEEVFDGYTRSIPAESAGKATSVSCTSLGQSLFQLAPRLRDKDHVRLFSTSFQKHLKTSSKCFQAFANLFIKRYPPLDLCLNEQST